MEVYHGGNVLPASANHSCACCILANTDHKPVIEGLQLLAARHWYSILVVLLLAVLLQCTQRVSFLAASNQLLQTMEAKNASPGTC